MPRGFFLKKKPLEYNNLQIAHMCKHQIPKRHFKPPLKKKWPKCLKKTLKPFEKSLQNRSVNFLSDRGKKKVAKSQQKQANSSGKKYSLHRWNIAYSPKFKKMGFSTILILPIQCWDGLWIALKSLKRL